MTAVAAELQAQVDDLNDERVRLLKKLRDGAASGAGAAVSGEAAGAGEGAQQRHVSWWGWGRMTVLAGPGSGSISLAVGAPRSSTSSCNSVLDGFSTR